MREIKFKCWVPGSKLMSEGHTWQEWVGTMAVEQMAPPDNTVWLQWSGLVDRNGKEIYEGDLVRYWPDDAHPTKARSVEWGGSGGYTGLNISRPEQQEVVGNIYEHPDREKSDSEAAPSAPVEKEEAEGGAERLPA